MLEYRSLTGLFLLSCLSHFFLGTKIKLPEYRTRKLSSQSHSLKSRFQWLSEFYTYYFLLVSSYSSLRLSHKVCTSWDRNQCNDFFRFQREILSLVFAFSKLRRAWSFHAVVFQMTGKEWTKTHSSRIIARRRPGFLKPSINQVFPSFLSTCIFLRFWLVHWTALYPLCFSISGNAG